jgi:hypothetical protein
MAFVKARAEAKKRKFDWKMKNEKKSKTVYCARVILRTSRYFNRLLACSQISLSDRGLSWNQRLQGQDHIFTGTGTTLAMVGSTKITKSGTKS